MILYNYSALFGGVREENDEEEKDIAKPQFDSRWKWFSIIERLAQGDITKFEDVYKQTYISSLNLLSYWKEKSDYEERIRRREEMMRKHR